jgi:c-di-GMP-binding flagellar brake protein YcgR
MQADLSSEKPSQVAPDRRRHPRYRFSTPITIRSADGLATRGITIEISQSGMSAITADALTINETVELEPIAAGKVSAVVHRAVGRVYGFEFLNLTPEQGQKITEICKSLPLYRGKSLGI